MKIIRLSTLLDFGGIESKMVNLSSFSDSNTWIFCCIGKGGAASNKISQNKKEVVCFSLPYKIPSLKALVELYLFFKRQKPDVVHCSGSEANFHGVLAATFAKVPVVISEEIGIPNHSRVAIILFNFIYSLSDFVVGESKVVVENLKKNYSINDKKLKVVSNFTLFLNEEIHFSSSRSSVFTILTVSRLESVKNIEGIIRVVYKLKQQKLKIKFIVVGDGSIKSDLEKLVLELNLKNDVEFVGFTEDTKRYYLACDLYVLNSFSEGFSNSLLEAMYFKKLVISTRVGAAEELLKENQNGWLIDLNNDDELFDKIKNCINLNDKIKGEIGTQAYNTVIEKFSITNHVAALLQLYTQK